MYTLEDQLIILHNELDMKFEAIYIGKVNKDDWECDRYIITLTNIFTKKIFQLDFYVGIGWLEQNKRPTPFDVLYSIRMDNPNGLTFNEWCMEFDYNNDSIKALNIYKQCIEQTEKFKEVFPNVDLDNFKYLDNY